jgi:hypothetical protein
MTSTHIIMNATSTKCDLRTFGNKQKCAKGQHMRIANGRSTFVESIKINELCL